MDPLMDLLLSPEGALALAVLTTLLAGLESTRLPWSPFLLLYAAALPIAPLLAHTYRFGSPAEPFRTHPWGTALLCAAILAWEIGIAGLLYEKVILPRLGKAWSPRWSPAAAMEALLDATALRRGLARGPVMAWYGFYFLAWAPLCEELFFWGYLYPVLRGSNGPIMASLIVSIFFGVRHGLHFLFLAGPFPWPAAAALMASTAGAAFLNGFLYETAGSLWILVLLHFASNLLALTIRPDQGPGGA